MQFSFHPVRYAERFCSCKLLASLENCFLEDRTRVSTLGTQQQVYQHNLTILDPAEALKKVAISLSFYTLRHAKENYDIPVARNHQLSST
ncbi:unnamed protein product [Peronospora farinosa]|uniref:Uncharacterized protein n=1 Tax=Peronospora farinosa TaxID=134698 RepID=A0AAV0TIJ8_9STRA|nr:unnamed protein product [Peronospora farinosa]CAI5722137.1 unnamed protein product [Peronospora farinosa]